MLDDSYDPKRMWQNQPTEMTVMTLAKIRQKVRELHTRTRRQLLGTLAGPLVAAFFLVFGIKQSPSLQDVLQPLFALALVWSLAGLYFLSRGRWSARAPEEAGFSGGLQFCRREIERQRDYLRRVVLWGFGPVLLAIATFFLALVMVAGRQIFSKAAPLMTLVVVWIAAYFVIRMRQQRGLQREIDELNAIERGNSR
jgi:MFS family permease